MLHDRVRRKRPTPRVVLLVGAPLALLALVGCGGSSGQVIRTELHPFGPEDRAIQAAAVDARYRLQPGDLFSVDFKYQDQLDQTRVMVLPDGHFTLAGLDEYPRAAGLTVPQLDSLLTGHFARDYLAPELTVRIDELGTMRVYVLGEVTAPGLIQIPPRGMGIVQAVAAAGGFSADAQKSQVVLIRVTPEGYLYRVCDLAHLEKRGFAAAALLDLRPFDVIYVPRSALGDLGYLSRTVLPTAVGLSQLFWDIYGIINIDKVDRIIR